MLEVFFAMLAAGMNASAGDAPVSVAAPQQPVAEAPLAESTETPSAPSTVEIAPEGVTIGEGVIIEGTPAPSTPAVTAPAAAQPTFNMDVVPAGLTPDAQVPTGTFTTAAEVKPILNATKGNWIALREYEGQDLLYITHLWSWRCGLKAIAISLNGEAMQNWPMPACRDGTQTPNAILPEDGLPYLTLKLGAVQTIKVQIVYDDLTMDVAEYDRNGALLP